MTKKTKSVDVLGKMQRKWVDALRSGTYKQGRYSLSRQNGDVMSYDVMGVLCEVLERPFKMINTERGATKKVYLNDAGEYTCRHIIPEAVAEAVGLRDRDGAFTPAIVKDGSTFCTLMGANDRGYSFSELADLIEERHKSLFAEKK